METAPPALPAAPPRLLGASAGAWALVALCWGLDVTGHALPEMVSRGAILAALAATAAWGGSLLAARFAGRSWRGRAAAALLPALLVLSLAVRVVGIDSEVEGRYYLDEGTYYHHATAIDGGEVLRRSFVYPHLTYYADALTLWMAARFPRQVAALAARIFHLTDPLAVSWLLLRLVVAGLSALTVVPVFRIAARLASAPAGGTGDRLGGAPALAGSRSGAPALGSLSGAPALAGNLSGAPALAGNSLGAPALAGNLSGAPALAGGLSGAPALAGALASLLIIFSALFNEGSHLNTCDVPAAFFATVCLACAARLLDEERVGGYLLAGMAAGLALASKYPAGLVAVAIAAVWLRWRLVRRDVRFGLLWAGLAALGTVCAVMPSLFAYPEMAFHGQRGIFFGARQYGGGGWLGVMPDSNSAFYFDKLAWSFGVPALAAGAAGMLTLGRARAARLLWLAPFPVLYLALVVSMNMVVKRNLYPVLPILSVFLGVGIAAGLQWLLGVLTGRATAAPQEMPPLGEPVEPGAGHGPDVARGANEAGVPGAADDGIVGSTAPAESPRSLMRRRLVFTAAGAAVLLLLAPPVNLTARQDLGLATPSTRDRAAAWIGAHLPPGSAIVKESYTPALDGRLFAISHERFAARIPIADLRDADNDYLLLSSAAYTRFRDPEALFTANQKELAQRYDEIFRTFPLVEEWIPDEFQAGPVLRLYRIDPLPADCQPSAVRAAADAFVSDPAMRLAPARPVRFTADSQWALFKGCLPAGSYRLTFAGAVLPNGLLCVSDALGRQIDMVALSAGGEPAGEKGPPGGTAAPAGPGAATGTVRLPRPGKYLFYAYLPPGSRLRELAIDVAGPPGPDSAPSPVR